MYNPMDDIYTMTEQFRDKYQDMIDRIIRMKLEQAPLIALQQGDYVLAEILQRMDYNDPQPTVHELADRGYTWEIRRPQDIGTRYEKGNLLVEINPNDIRIRIYKTVLEV